MKKLCTGGIALIINNEGGRILPSETFLLSHLKGLPKPITPIVGIPGERFLINENMKTVPTRSIIPLGFRWLMRKCGFSTIEKQDKRAFARFLKKRNISVVLAEYGPTAVSVMDACVDASVPLVAHFHGFDAYKDIIIDKYGKKYLKLFDKACIVIAVSEHMRKQLISLGANENKTFVNSCGAEIPKHICANPKLSNKNFLMVGRLIEKKAPFLSILAFSEIIKKIPDSTLDIIGDGPLLKVCQQIVISYGLSNNVFFHGVKSHQDVLAMMQGSRCFIQHSVCSPDGDHEGTPVAVLEAMGVGLAVIATRHGGISDVIVDGVTGILIEEYDVESMSNAMQKIAESPELAQKLGTNAQIAINKYWTSEKSVSRLWKIMERSMKN